MTTYTLAQNTGGYVLTGLSAPGNSTYYGTLSAGFIFGLPYSDAYNWSAIGGKYAAITEGLHIHPALIEVYGAYGLVDDSIQLHAAETPAFSYHLNLAAHLKLSAQLATALTVLLHSGIKLSTVLELQWALSAAEQLKFKPHHAPNVYYTTTVSDFALLSAAISRHIGGSIAEHMHLSPVIHALYAANAAVAENILLDAALVPTLQIILLEQENIGLEDENAVRAIYTQALNDSFNFDQSYLIPGNDGTTWVLNTRTGAVTEYTNFNFNSMVRMGTGGLVYLGASNQGLYGLYGDTDNGNQIISDMLGGLIQFSHGKLSSIQAAYLGVRSSSTGGTLANNQFYLKLRTEVGQEYVYAVQPDPMRNTRINLGKGLRARYFSYELVSTGQDFDLDSIMFLPVEQQRFI